MTELNLSEINLLVTDILDLLVSGDNDQYPIRVKVEDILKRYNEKSQYVFGALYILSNLGFSEIINGEVIVNSKYPKIALKAIKKRLDSNNNIFDHLREEDKKLYFRTFTKNLEHIRKDLQGESQHIHTRKILNLIIKGKQIKKWKNEDVFLHIYHDSWKQYHLVGLGFRDETTIDQLIKKVMKEKINLDETDFEIDDTVRPPLILFNELSETQGAVTHYEIETRVVKKINLDLNEHIVSKLSSKDKYEPIRFRWFSYSEIKQKEVDGSSIMKSSLLVLEPLTLSNIPLVVPNAKNYSKKPLLSINLTSDIQNRITRGRMARVIVIFLLGIILIVYPLKIDGDSLLIELTNNYLGIIASCVNLIDFYFNIKE